MLSLGDAGYSVIITYSLLLLSVVLLWTPKVRGMAGWVISAAFCIIIGLYANQLNLSGAAILVTLALLLILFNRTKNNHVTQFILGSLVLLLSVGLTMHWLPGFNNLKIMANVYISNDGLPFTLYLNIDKTLMGIFILGLTHYLIQNGKEILPMAKRMLPLAAVTILVTMLLALGLNYVHFEPKLPREFLAWSMVNLLFVCLAEEALFRGFIQRNLTAIFSSLKFGPAISILIAAFLFGLMHYAGGWKYILLATVAGVGYGVVYHSTKRIEASILTHFLLNVVHMLFFTYPALANSI